MNTRYITAILRDQFNLFFRYGFTSIHSSLAFKVEVEIDKSILELFSKLTPFYDESHYILLEFETTNDSFLEPIFTIEIQDLVKIYPLSKLASATIKQSRLDTRIKIEEPKFEHLLFDIELMFRKKNLFRSVKAIWKICDMDSEPDELFNKIGIDNILKGIEFRKRGAKANMIIEGDYWNYLIAYDSYNLNFPSSTLGHFYDAGEVFAYSNNQETFVGSRYYNFLETLNSKNPNLTLQEIINELEVAEEINAYRNKTTTNELKKYLIAPLFLLLKEDIRKEIELSKSKLVNKDYLLKVGGENFKAALVLLGAFFGFDKFYDSYYDNLNLRFYKSYQPVKEKKEGAEKTLSEKQPVVDEQVVLEDKPVIHEPTLSNDQPTSEELLESVKQVTDKVETISKEQEIALKDNQEKKDEYESNENIESKKEVEILPTEDLKRELSENQTDYQIISNDETEIVIKLKEIIGELIRIKTEMKLTDIGEKIKEMTGQKVTNTIIKNVIKLMGNVEIVPKKKPETARQVIMQDLFNKQKL